MSGPPENSKQPNLFLRRDRRCFLRRRGRLRCFRGEGAGENLDFLLRVSKAVAARFDETHAFLVTLQQLLQRQFGVLHLGDDLFETGDQVLEFLRRISSVGGRGKKSA